jgi:hypothetical protein
MRAKKILAGVFIGLACIMVFTTVNVQAQCCYYNPLFLPFAVAGAVVGTAAAIVTAPFTYPAYYGPPPGYYAPARAYYGPGPYRGDGVWIRGHYNRDGAWVPGHRRHYR